MNHDRDHAIPPDSLPAGPLLPGAEPPGGEPERAPGMPPIPGIDPAWVAATFDSDRKFFLQMLQMFTSRYAGVAAEIRRMLARGEQGEAASLAHALRGAAGNLGAHGIMAQAAELERAIAAGRSDLEELLEEVARQSAHLAAAAAPFLRELAERPPVPVAGVPPLDPARLAELRDALTHRNLRALELFAGLEPALAGVHGEATTRSMAEAINQLRFAEALRLLAEGPDA